MHKKIKLALIISLITSLFLGIVASILILPYTITVERYSANPALGFHADYYLYISPKAINQIKTTKKITILVQPNNSGVTSDDIDVHRRDAWWTGFERHQIADELGVVLLVPAFIRSGKDWKVYTHALDRDVFTTPRPDLSRLDLQLLAMVQHAQKNLKAQGFSVNKKIIIQGFSASGMFANRFAILHPEQVLAVTAGSPGGWPVAPVAQWNNTSLPYPAGVADIKTLTGKTFNFELYQQLPQLIFMGSLDENDSVDYRDGWDQKPAEMLDKMFGTTPMARWQSIQQIHQQAATKTEFILIDGVGHNRKKLQKYSTKFFINILENNQ